MHSLAWRAMTHGARSVYVVLKGRYNTKLENSVYVSSRDMQAELGSHSHRDDILRWYRELVHYGFLRMVAPAHHGVNGHGRAPHYRLTEHGYVGHAPTRDYLEWDGTVFDEPGRSGIYAAKNRSRGPNVGTALAPTSGPPDGQSSTGNGTTGPNAGAMCESGAGPNVGSITSSTTPNGLRAFAGSNLFNEYFLLNDPEKGHAA